jgi:uncharacterized protein YggU (UPF0235/DUF167 family)
MKTRLTLKIRPGARKTAFAGKLGEVWKLQVAAPPVDGKANDAIMRFLAKLAGVPSSGVRIVSGFTGSTKIVELEGIDSETLDRVIVSSNESRGNTGSAAARKA